MVYVTAIKHDISEKHEMVQCLKKNINRFDRVHEMDIKQNE